MNVQLLLEEKGLWGFVDNTEPEPPASSKEIREYRIRKIKARALICLCVNEDLQRVATAQTTAKAAWDTLKATYYTVTRARKSRLCREFLNLAMKENEDMAVFLAREDEAAEQLKNVEIIVTDEEKAFQ